MNPALALALLQALPTVVSELGAWYLRAQRAREVYALPDGPEKEAAIQAELDSLRTGEASLERLDKALGAP